MAGDEPATVGPPPSNASRIEWALWYAQAHGWPVFAVYEMRENDAGHLVCSCGDAACDSPGKHPRTLAGWKDATTDADQIRAWWERWPCANIGTPHPSVLDCDLPRDSDPADGVAEWRKLERKHGVITGVAVARSGGGGLHVYFAPGAPGGKAGRGSDARHRVVRRAPSLGSQVWQAVSVGTAPDRGAIASPTDRRGSRIARRQPRAS